MYKAIILEDDITSALKYELVLKELNVELLATHKSWEEVFPSIKKQKPDFIIVDLFLNNNQSGMTFIEEIQNLFIPIILVTGFPQESQAKQAVDLNVKHYLTKPVNKTSLRFAISNLIKQLDRAEKSKEHLVVKERGNLIKVPFSDIVKVEIDGNYTTVVMNNNKKFILKSSLSKVHEKLDQHTFVRCHRSTIVNFDYVKSMNVSTNKITLSTGTEVALGNRFRSSVKKRFNELEL